jgi:hypothetical protein
MEMARNRNELKDDNEPHRELDDRKPHWATPVVSRDQTVAAPHNHSKH